MRRVGLVLLLIFTAPALAVPGDRSVPFKDERGRSFDNLVMPKESPLHFSRWANGNSHRAEFKGRFLLSGTYYYGDADLNDGPNFLGEAIIILDDTRLLPRFVVRHTMNKIYISNADGFAAAVVPPDMLRKVQRKHGSYATGHITIWADGFTAEIACDSPNYTAHFESLYRSPIARLESSQPLGGC